MLSLGMAASAASSMALYGVPFLVPQLDLTLPQAGLVIGAPSLGMMLTLIAWGAAADRYGERIVMVLGLGGAAVALTFAGYAPGPVALGVALLLAGACGAS